MSKSVNFARDVCCTILNNSSRLSSFKQSSLKLLGSAKCSLLLGHAQQLNILFQQRRCISTTPIAFLQELRETKVGKVTTIEAVKIPDPDKDRLMLLNAEEGCCNNLKCPLCGIVEDLRYDDVLVMNQFMRQNGQLLPRNITGLCGFAQKRLGSVVTQAGKAGMFRGAFQYNRIDNKKRWPKSGGWRLPRYFKDQQEFVFSPFTYDWIKKPKYPQQ